MPGFDTGSVMYALNVDFTGNSLTSGSAQVTANGQLLIGNATSPQIRVGTLTSPSGSITIGYSAPNITLDVSAGGVVVEKFALQSGTTPVSPLAGIVTFNGAAVAAGTKPVLTNGTGANTMQLQVQRSQALAATDATKVGLSNFSSAQFTVDANGFVNLKGSTTNSGILGVHPNATSGAGTDPTVADASGNISILGGTVAAGTNPVRTVATAANSLTTQVQISQAIASTDATKIGLAAFNSANFTVDANGFVSLTSSGFTWSETSGAFNAAKNNGYFITAAATATLPASLAEGDTIDFSVDTASNLTITANTGQTIRLGTTVTAAAGTAVNTQRGDAIQLVYKSTGTVWMAQYAV